MSNHLEIRPSRPEDMAAIESLYPEAFPDEDLLPLVTDLLTGPAVVTSLIAERDGRPQGHGLLTECGLSEGNVRAALLGPVAVAPDSQKQGVGSAIVRDGLRRVVDRDVGIVCVLGDPAYYGRFGFEPDASIEPPYPLPEAWKTAWQSVRTGKDTGPLSGTLVVPPPWRDAALWSS